MIAAGDETKKVQVESNNAKDALVLCAYLIFG
jgi:hypothetical protein